MNRKALIIIGVVLVLGAVLAVSATKQDTGGEIDTNSGEHECPLEIMEFNDGRTHSKAKN